MESNKLKELYIEVMKSHFFELTKQVNKIKDNICLLHVSDIIKIEISLINIYQKRLKNQIYVNQKVNGLEDFLISLTTHLGEVARVYSLYVEDTAIIILLKAGENRVLGWFSNNYIGEEKTRILWREYLQNGILNKNFYAFNQMEEIDITKYLNDENTLKS
jgi:hypothetical protein